MTRAALVVLWLVATAATGVLGFIGYELTRGARVGPEAQSIDRLPPRQNYNPRARWSVTEHFSAHHVLIAHVETDFLDEAMQIAEQLTQPIEGTYAEVLIYFHRPGRPDTLAPRRVQWSPKTGYVESVYE